MSDDSIPRPSAAGTRILDRSGTAPALIRRRAALEVSDGPSQGRALQIEGTSIRVGGDTECDLVLADETVSSVHFEISVDESGWRLRDLESTNGTRVDGLRVRDVFLPDGAEIRAGQSTLRFTLGKDEVELALSRRTNFGGLLGHSPAMRAAFAILERAAKTDSTVLVLGESGTGKELAARGVHEGSRRAAGPYVVFDCGAATPSLLESQLFGHARGAFTGASEERSGVFEDAHEGTLVLDEVGELPLDLQPKLLRALEQRTVSRIGESTVRSVDVRFVACTHRNLEEEVRAGRFREDLFFRLSVLSVRLPPLRERPEEVPRLVRGLLSKLGADVEVSSSTMQLLMGHRWPGNVRELRNVVERMVALPDLDARAWLPDAPRQQQGPILAWDAPFHEAKQSWIDAFERSYLERLVAKHADNLSEAARVAGLSRQSCYRLLKKHGIGTSDE